MESGLVSTQIFLRPLKANDVSIAYLSWMQDPDIVRHLELRVYPKQIEDLREYVSSSQLNREEMLFGIFARENEQHIGNIKVGPRDPLHLTASIGILIGETQFWSKGIATESIVLASNWAFREFNCAKVTAGCHASNLGSLRAFMKAGFKVEGFLQSQVKLSPAGVRADAFLLGLLPDRPATLCL